MNSDMVGSRVYCALDDNYHGRGIPAIVRAIWVTDNIPNLLLELEQMAKGVFIVKCATQVCTENCEVGFGSLTQHLKNKI